MARNARSEDLQGIRVLVLGLHPHLSRRVREDLARFGVTGDNTTSTEEATNKASQQHFDALLVGGGMTAAQADEAYAGIPARFRLQSPRDDRWLKTHRSLACRFATLERLISDFDVVIRFCHKARLLLRCDPVANPIPMQRYHVADLQITQITQTIC